MELSFTKVTTKTWEHSRRFGFFRTFFWLKFSPLVKSYFKNTIGNPFFLLQGVEVSPSHEDNSWWESVGQVESVEKIMKNIKTGKVTKTLRKNNLLQVVIFQNFGNFAGFNFFKMIFQLIRPVLRTPTNYCVHY